MANVYFNTDDICFRLISPKIIFYELILEKYSISIKKIMLKENDPTAIWAELHMNLYGSQHHFLS